MLGWREEELTSMQPADAVEFFHKQKIKGTHAEIEAACALYGYHPLSLRLLAGRILKDFENPADIIVAQRLKIDGDIIQQKHHVLEVSYHSLPHHEQKLLSTIACFRSPVEHKTLEAIVEDKNSLDDDLHDLVARGLLNFDEKNKKFDLHPIVRRYAYERLTAPDRAATHTRLRDYFATVDVPEEPHTLEELAPLIELYYHTVRAEKFDDACDLLYDRINPIIYYYLAAYQLHIELLSALFPDGENNLPRLEKDSDKAWALNSLANSYASSGQPNHAVMFFELQNKLNEQIIEKGHLLVHFVKENLAKGLGNLADMAQTQIGMCASAEHNLEYMLRRKQF